MKKKLVALLMAIVLMGGIAGTISAQAAQYTEEEVSDKILYVKNLFDIGDEYCNFSQDVWDNGRGQTWSFSWNNSDYNKSIYVNIDEKGRLVSYNKYDYSSESISSVPKDFPEYYEKTAMEAIGKYLPEIVDRIKLDTTRLDYYSNCYRFYYIRYENGYPMPDNNISISVNHMTEEIMSLNATWDYDVTIAKPDKLLEKKEAASKLDGELEMELQYICNYSGDKKEAFLAYVPSERYLSVDAVSGKVYTEKAYYYSSEEGYAEDALEAKETTTAGGRNGATLTEAEIKKVKEITSLISKEDAIAVVTSNKDLLLDSGLKQTNAYLSGYGDEYYWQITMSDPRPVDYSSSDYYRAYADARVDAKTGKLLYFWSSVRDYYDYSEAVNIEFKYNKKEAVKKFEKFVKALEPEKFDQTRKTSDSSGYVIYYDYEKDSPIYGGRYVTYSRLVNGIPFYNDAIKGAVDRVTGKVYSYSVDWSEDIEFPSPDNAITAKAAFDKYLESDEFVLKYELISNTKWDEETYTSTTTTKSRLCYVTEIRAPYVDAFTGGFLNYNGEEYKPALKNRTFTDISGHKYEKEIRFITLLMDVVEGDKFEPDKYVTNEFVADLFDNMWYFARVPQNLKSDNKAIKREELAKIVVEALGYKDLSELDIFNLSYKDAEKVSKDCKGAVAICGGLKLFDVKKNGKFKPASKITRGELAYVLAKALVSGQNRY
ncbi:MAG: S-layer homology domain-containing protein [Lachnospiraceae bacterium]|nr:S-layer homology domain-containing protein [Lachnospiraceae bacterium]